MGIVLALIMTFTVESKSAVRPSGELPAGIEAAYSCTYQKGTVRAGDTLELKLSGLGGIDMERVDLSMRSNKSSGAGTITVTADGETAATLSGSYKDWTGAYDASAYYDITALDKPVQDVEEVTIRVVGSENSLYVASFTISYRPPRAYTVTLMKGLEETAVLTESYGGAGVLLPMMNDTTEWHFLGWSEREFYTEYATPHCLAANTLWHPKGDQTLWACYAYQDSTQDTYVSDLQTGEYLYVNVETGMALSGVTENGRMTAEAINTHDEWLYYFIEMTAPDSAFITHAATNIPIGWSGTKLAEKASPWLVYHEGIETLFYTIINDKKYVLWLNILEKDESDTYVGLQMTDSLANSPMRLMMPLADPKIAYTCHPECGVGIETVNGDRLSVSEERVLMHLGNYELKLQNGQKRLIHK